MNPLSRLAITATPVKYSFLPLLLFVYACTVCVHMKEWSCWNMCVFSSTHVSICMWVVEHAIDHMVGPV